MPEETPIEIEPVAVEEVLLEKLETRIPAPAKAVLKPDGLIAGSPKDGAWSIDLALQDSAGGRAQLVRDGQILSFLSVSITDAEYDAEAARPGAIAEVRKLFLQAAARKI